jgi:conjugal transfer pilus assembly protein TraK
MKTNAPARAALVLLAALGSAQAVELPTVPASVLASTSQTPPPPVVPVSPSAPLAAPSTPDPQAAATGSQAEIAAPPLKVTTEANHLLVKPGVTEIVPIALGHLNRIVTPFDHPVAKTTSTAAIHREGNVLYVAPKSETPVGLYITEKGDESVAISVTFVPKKIPPRDITLTLKSDLAVVGRYSKDKATKWERAHPYEEMLRQTFRQIALGQLPQGYALRPAVPAARRSCLAEEAERAGVRFTFDKGQLLTGARIEVAVGLVRNTGLKPVELKETWCAAEDVAGVAFWPEVVLEPGQATEVYVAFQRRQPKPNVTERPSLLGTTP